MRYFLEVAQCGSLAEASARLHVAASALSRQIASLESQLETPLFERLPRGMVLTPAGEILAAQARRTDLDIQGALQDIVALKGQHAGQVRVATSDAFGNDLLPRLSVAFRQAHEGVHVALQVMATAQVPEAVQRGDADIGVCFSRAPHRDIHVAYRQTAPVLALMPPGHALARGRGVTLARMVDFPLALPPTQAVVRQMIDLACSRQGLVLTPAMVSNHVQPAVSFVVHGGGLAVASEIAVRHLANAGTLVARPIVGAGMDLRDIEVQTLAARNLPLLVQAFIESLKAGLAAGRGTPRAAGRRSTRRSSWPSPSAGT